MESRIIRVTNSRGVVSYCGDCTKIKLVDNPNAKATTFDINTKYVNIKQVPGMEIIKRTDDSTVYISIVAVTEVDHSKEIWATFKDVKKLCCSAGVEIVYYSLGRLVGFYEEKDFLIHAEKFEYEHYPEREEFIILQYDDAKINVRGGGSTIELTAELLK